MKQIAKAPLGSDLSIFSQWLLSEGLQHRITELEGMQVILSSNESYKTQVEQALEQYLSEPEFRVWVNAQLSDNLNRRQFSASSDHELLLNYTRATPRQAPVIFILMFVSVIFAYLSDFGEGGPFFRVLLILDPFKLSLDLSTMSGRWNGLIELLAMGEVWRVISPDFIHFNMMHITFNLLMLWVLGGQLEIQKGSISFIALVVFVSIVSNIAQLLETSYLFGGMSGVVYGLVGYCWLWKYFQPTIFFPSALMKFCLGWLVLGYTPLTEWLGWGRMANAAHLYGLFAGLIWGGVTLFVNDKLLSNK